MIQDDLLAIAILAFPALVVLARPWRDRAMFVAFHRLRLPVLIAVVYGVITLVLTNALTPWYPRASLVSATLSTCLALALSGKMRQRAIYGSATMVLGVAIVMWHWHVAGAPGLCAMTQRTYRGQVNFHLEEVRERLLEAGLNADATEHPAGWASDVFRSVPAELAKVSRSFPDRQPLWHSHLTGIGRNLGTRAFGIWYPGGRVADAILRLEVRDLPFDDPTRQPDLR